MYLKIKTDSARRGRISTLGPAQTAGCIGCLIPPLLWLGWLLVSNFLPKP
jgi:hypothetical protein